MDAVSKPGEVQYYSHLEKSLKQSQLYKAEKFLALDRIQYDTGKRVFVCLPIKGYNTRTYTLTRVKEPWCYLYADAEGNAHERKVEHECNCQFAQKCKREGKPPWCSHLLALHLWFDRRNKAHGWGRWKQDGQGILEDDGK